MTLARDAELDRLKTAQDRAFQRKQDAHQVQQRAWEKRSSAREVMNRAYEEKQRAYAEQDQSWQYLQQVRSANGPQIDSLNARQEDAYRNMKAAYDAASAAYERRDGTAKDRAAEGRRYKEQSQGFVAERRRLVAEIRSAGDRHHATKPAFQRANAEFKAARATFDAAKAEHERAQAEFKTAKAAFAQAQAAFRSRLDKVKAEGARRNQDRQALARQAGVPAQYLDKVWVSQDPMGNTNIYFGGVGKPNGPGHGHYVLDRLGKVTYQRDPFDPHGGQNFTANQEDYYSLVAREGNVGDFGFRCRFRGYDAYVETNVNREGRPKIDIYYGPNGPFGPGHHHAVALRESPFDFVYDELR